MLRFYYLQITTYNLLFDVSLKYIEKRSLTSYYYTLEPLKALNLQEVIFIN